ncbi:MAG: GNAT family N-acetyltransferase [Ktedonobacterales bacterium]
MRSERQPDSTVWLVTPDVAHEAASQAMPREFLAGEEPPLTNVELALAEFQSFVRELADEARGVGLPPGVVPRQTYWLQRDDGTLVGEIRLRPRLTEPFERHHGHIGYNIRPSARGQGYATRQLALVLERAREQGLRRVMLPVEGENPASVRVIEKNGGRLGWRRRDGETGEMVTAYWIELMSHSELAGGDKAQ